MPGQPAPPAPPAPPAAAAPPAPAEAPAPPPAQASPLHEPVSDRSEQGGGPVSVAWREGTLTRALELEALRAWVLANGPLANSKPLSDAVLVHLQAAREAATAAKLKPRKWLRPPRSGPLIERAMSNLDAAEALLLNFASPEYVLGQMPCLLRHAQCHLIPTDPRRQEFERIARKLEVKDPDHPLLHDTHEQSLREKRDRIEEERGKIVTVVRAASSAALRDPASGADPRRRGSATQGMQTVAGADHRG